MKYLLFLLGLFVVIGRVRYDVPMLPGTKDVPVLVNINNVDGKSVDNMRVSIYFPEADALYSSGQFDVDHGNIEPRWVLVDAPLQEEYMRVSITADGVSRHKYIPLEMY
jgi:hypothetical protein